MWRNSTLTSSFTGTPQNCTFNNSSSAAAPATMAISCVVLTACFLVGVPSNLAVVIDISRNYRRYTSKVNPTIVVLVFNLAVVDSITLGSSPLVAYVLAKGWTLGLAFCKIFSYVISCCLYGSVFTVTGMSVKYLIIIKSGVPNSRMLSQLRRREKPILIVLLWSLAVLLSIPILFTRQVEEKRGLYRCVRRAVDNTGQMATLLVESVMGFVLPFSILLVSYMCFYKSTTESINTRAISSSSADAKQKITRHVVSVLVAFLICWIPFHIINMVDVSAILLYTSGTKTYCIVKSFRIRAGDVLKSLPFINSCVNPFLYAFALWKKLSKNDNVTTVTDDTEVDTSSPAHNFISLQLHR